MALPAPVITVQVQVPHRNCNSGKNADAQKMYRTGAGALVT
jgi:hypothetical protein